MSLRSRIDQRISAALATSGKNTAELRSQQMQFAQRIPCIIKSVEGTTITVQLNDGTELGDVIAGTTTPIVGMVGIVVGNRFFGP